MGVMRRVAVLAGQCDEEYQNGFLKGFLSEAFSRDYEVLIFSMNRKYMDTKVREVSESRIYDLFVPEDYDAVVILRDSIQTPGVGDALEERIHASFNGPVLVIDIKSKYFPSILTDSEGPCYELVSHLIEKHGYTDIAYLTGKKWHEHSIMRLNAYKRAMTDHGLEVNEDRIIYGDYWYTSGEVAVQTFINGRGLPQAVACANDQMAEGLCKALESRGYEIGKDIAVVGFDSREEGRRSPKPITSCILPTRENGVYAAAYIDDTLNGNPVKPYKEKAKFYTGESCGCRSEMLTDPAKVRSAVLRPGWDTEISKEGFNSIYNNMMNNLLNETELRPFLKTVYSYAYQLDDAESFSLCMCEPWKDIDSSPDVISDVDGVTSKMILAVNYGKEGSNNADTSEVFDSRDLLPQLRERGTAPRAFYFTPWYCEDRFFGYGVISYGDVPRTYSRSYCKWMNLVGVGFEGLRRTSIINLLQNTSLSIKNYRIDQPGDLMLSPDEREEFDLTMKILDENLFSYHFQPIINVNEGNIFSYEALMRSGTETKISPMKILKYAELVGRVEDVEKATFLNVMTRIDDFGDRLEGKKVFINSIPGVKLSEEDRMAVYDSLARHADSVVVEFTEESQLTDEDLTELNTRYTSMGIWTALDDYGTGYSNVSNLLRYMPNIVKIDRSLLSGIQDKPQKKHFVKNIIDFCHQNNMLALAEGVESAAELQNVIFLGADLIQGFYTGRPSPRLLKDISPELKSEIEKYVKEREIGTIRYSYETGKTNRITLSNLIKIGYTDIVVKGENAVYKDVTIIGAPGQETNLFMSVEDGYVGRVDIEDVCLTGTDYFQCIELGENVNMTLCLKGSNKLRLGGIYVPRSSKLTITGDGNLDITVEKSFFGIGAGENERCGTLIFDQNGEIKIVSKSAKGVCIGSGLSCEAEIRKGKYLLECDGSENIGIGSFSGNGFADVKTCLIEVRLNSSKCCGIGSFDGDSVLSVENSTICIVGGGQKTVCIGNMNGNKATMNLTSVYVEQSIRSLNTVCFGCVNGKSELSLKTCRLSVSVNGDNSLVFGGFTGDGKVLLDTCDVSVVLNNELGTMSLVKPENVRVIYEPDQKPRLLLCSIPIESITDRVKK